MAEITFEAMLMALESTSGTAVEPTHYMPVVGTLSPSTERYMPDESRGTLIANYRSKLVRKSGSWTAEGPLDVKLLPVLLNMVATGDMTGQPTTPGGTNPRLWTFVPTVTSNDLKTATLYWGDQNVQMFKGVFATVDELTISSDASGTEGARMSLNGMANWPDYDTASVSAITAANPGVVTTSAAHGFADGDKVRFVDVGGMTELNDNIYTVANGSSTTFELSGVDTTGFTTYTSGGTIQKVAPVFPSVIESSLIAGIDMQVWLDTSSAIGTTEIVGRVVSAEHVIPTNYSYKYVAQGPTGNRTYSRVGRNKRFITTRVTMELIDLDQYNLFADDENVKLRVRHNGDLIEAGYYNYVEVDTYGKLQFTDWGELEGTNRTVQFEVMSEYNTGAGHDWAIRVQNDRTAL